MGAFFVYILKSSVCLALFYLFYRLLLSRETFHRFNRVAVLSILLLSLLIPVCEVTIKQQTEIGQTLLTLEQLLMMAQLTGGGVETAAVQPVMPTWIYAVLLIYIAGILFFVCRNCYSLIRVAMLLRSGRREKLQQGVTVIIHNRDNLAPFSWMRFVAISEKDLEENGREILIHELAHIRNRHSIDLLLVEICIFFQWFNPAAWLLKQELQNIHEFEADETVLKAGVNAKQYQLLLIKKAVGTRLYSMANSFNHSKLKKRITMMLKEKSSPWARLKYLYVLPVAAIAVTAFARPEVSNELKEISEVKVNDLVAIVETKAQETPNEVFQNKETVVVQKTVTDNKPEKKSTGQLKVDAGSGNNLTGQLKSVRVKGDSVKPQDPDTPRYYIRIDGKASVEDYSELEKEDSEKEVKVVGVGPMKSDMPFKLHSFGSTDNPPLVIIDGKESSMVVLSALNSQHIESVSVLKDAAPVDIYGDKGKNGVVIVDLKENPGPPVKRTEIKLRGSKEEALPEGVLLLVDGKSYDSLDHIDADKIESIRIIKRGEQNNSEEKAMFGQYGDEAKNGVVWVELKK